MIDSIPNEIRLLDSWMLGTAKKVPHTIIDGGKWVASSSTDASNWLPYSTVVAGCKKLGNESLPGFVLHDGHPYAVIDLDIKDADNCTDSSKWTTDEAKEMYSGIVDDMGSYAEVSRSGKGVHIIVRVAGKSDHWKWPNVKKSGVEVYFRDRFIVTTGNHIEGTPLEVADATENVAALLQKLAPEKFVERPKLVDLGRDDKPILSDDEVLDGLETCGNAERYLSLMDGEWDGDYPSQSEADASLVEGIYYFSGNREQTARIFMRTKLADREKAMKNNYVVRTVNRIADRVDEDDIDLGAITKGIDLKVDFSSFSPSSSEYDADQEEGVIPMPTETVVDAGTANGHESIGDDKCFVVGNTVIDLSLHTTQSSLVNAIMAAKPAAGTDVVSLINRAEEQRKRCLSGIAAKYWPSTIGEVGAPSLNDVLNNRIESPYKMPQGFSGMPFGVGDNVDIELPLGILGDLINWSINFSVKQAKEASVAACLGYLSGLMGKAWQIGTTGLNNYVVCVGKSAVGKSSAGESIEVLHKRISDALPQAYGMLYVGYPVSDKGVWRDIEENDSMVYKFDEFVKFVASATTGRNTITKGVLDEVLKLYDKSGYNKVAGGMSYSKKENSIQIRKNVGLSFFGDGVADDYYKSLTGQMVSDGMVSRFTVIEYTGFRQYSNENQSLEPPEHVVNALIDIASNALQLNQSGKHIKVNTSVNAQEELRRIDRESDDIINQIIANDSGSKLTNFITRRLLKIKKIAGIMAVLDGHNNPTIDIVHVHWARHVIDQCIARELWWVRQGIVNGVSDDAVIDDLFMSKIEGFVANPTGDKRVIELASSGVVQMSTLRDIARKIPAVAEHRSGLNDRYKLALKSLSEIGRLKYYSRRTAQKNFGITNECYGVVVGE